MHPRERLLRGKLQRHCPPRRGDVGHDPAPIRNPPGAAPRSARRPLAPTHREDRGSPRLRRIAGGPSRMRHGGPRVPLRVSRAPRRDPDHARPHPVPGDEPGHEASGRQPRSGAHPRLATTVRRSARRSSQQRGTCPLRLPHHPRLPQCEHHGSRAWSHRARMPPSAALLLRGVASAIRERAAEAGFEIGDPS